MRRGAFITRAAASALCARTAIATTAFCASARAVRAHAQQSDDADPALAAQPSPALRVLLGSGDAQPVDATSFLYEGRRYRGTFVRLADGGVVTTVPLEQYLYSVVSREMPASWPAAALQAQAICARTYVLQRSEPNRDYDVVSSEADQVYEGADAELPACRAAVDASAGTVVQYDGGFASVAYSSSCGGHTESAADAWGGAGAPYLQGVVCPWCTISPDYRWSSTIAADAIASAFAVELGAVGTPTDLAIGPRDASGRARAIVASSPGGSAALPGSAFRARLGARVVRSLMLQSIAPGDTPGAFVLSGAGLGHGVGLCQWGANGMARAGKSAADILSFYFPSTGTGHD